MMRLSHTLTLAALIAAGAASPAYSAPLKAAVFKFELVDSSQEGERDGERADQTARLERIEAQVRDRLKGANVELVDLALAADDLKDVKAVHECAACAQKAALKVGADVSVVGFVQKVSNLILNINIEIRDARTGEVVRFGSTDIRGNTDEMWDRGASYLMRNQILEKPRPEGRG